MSQSDLMQEIEEDLQRQQIEQLWKNYGRYIVAAVLAIVLGTGAYVSWNNYSNKQQEEATSQLQQILEAKNADKTKQIAALSDFAKKFPDRTQTTLARLHAAALAIKNNETDKALAIYDEMAKDNSVEVEYRQFADFLAVQAQMDSGDPRILLQRLEPLLVATSAWRFSAKEYAAHLALKSGDQTRARNWFKELTEDKDAPATIIARTHDMLGYLNEAQ